jgi:hypothetical protein
MHLSLLTHPFHPSSAEGNKEGRHKKGEKTAFLLHINIMSVLFTPLLLYDISMYIHAYQQLISSFLLLDHAKPQPQNMTPHYIGKTPSSFFKGNPEVTVRLTTFWGMTVWLQLPQHLSPEPSSSSSS